MGMNIPDLYRLAYFGKHFWDYGDSLNGKAWFFPIYSDGVIPNEDQRYSFSTSYTSVLSRDLEKIFQSTLADNFGYTVSVEKRNMVYYSVNTDSAKIASLRSKGDKKIRRRNHTYIDFQNVTLDELIKTLAYYDITYIPFINESPVNFTIDIKVNAILTDQSDLFSSLADKGIVIQKKERPMRVLILTKEKRTAAY